MNYDLETDPEEPIYIWIAFDSLTILQQSHLPSHILDEVKENRLKTPRVHGYSEPIVVIGQNLRNPNDIECTDEPDFSPDAKKMERRVGEYGHHDFLSNGS